MCGLCVYTLYCIVHTVSVISAFRPLRGPYTQTTTVIHCTVGCSVNTKARHFLTDWVAVNFPRKTLPCWVCSYDMEAQSVSLVFVLQMYKLRVHTIWYGVSATQFCHSSKLHHQVKEVAILWCFIKKRYHTTALRMTQRKVGTFFYILQLILGQVREATIKVLIFTSFVCA